MADEKSDGIGRLLSRHTKGWQTGLLVLLLAGSAIVFVTPRPVAPTAFPAPRISWAALQSIELSDDAAARQAERVQLDVDVRRLGSAFRAYNTAVADGDADGLVRERARLLKASGVAVARSEPQTLALRAYQMQLFLQALRRWSATGERDETLRALGGDFVNVLVRSRWCDPDSRRLRASLSVLRVLFKKRFNDLTGLNRAPFALTTDEDKLRYGFLIEHPFVASGQVVSVEAAVRRRQSLSGRLSLVDKLALLDKSYPADLVRGTLLFRAQRFLEASNAYRRWLSLHPDGPYTLRARNYLHAAMVAAQGQGY